MSEIQNPIIPGFNPDPSIVAVDGWYYLVTSTFEYLPGIPVHRSQDLINWELIGHVVDRPGQLKLVGVPTLGGAWAPTIRHHDGLFYVVVTDALGRGNLIFTSEDPAGPWSHGLEMQGVDGIDPDLAWDDDGNCFLTYSGLSLNSTSGPKHNGIQQVRIDLQTGKALEEPRSLWSGTGLMFPEAPHLYQVGDWWYLMVAEGGTERGHSVSIARSSSPEGPFTGAPLNPILSARSTDRPVQNTGHADLLQCFDGTWRAVMLGMQTRGGTRAFSALGRQTFMTEVDWVDEWPTMQPIIASTPVVGELFSDDFVADTLGPEWVAIRRTPAEFATVADGQLSILGHGQSMNDPLPSFVGVRQQALFSTVEVDISRCTGVGGLTIRYDERHHFDLELSDGQITARATLSSISTEQTVDLPSGPTKLFMQMRQPPSDFESGMTCDMIALGWIDDAGQTHDVGVFDGRFLSAESTCSFTGRVIGLYCSEGELVVNRYLERSSMTEDEG